MAYLLALDQGTSSSRAILFDEEGRLLRVAQTELPQIYPKPGWVEHDPIAIWSTQMAVAAEVLAAAGVSPRELAAIGIANQRETTLLWERRTGRPVYNAIVWQDRRTALECDRLRAEGAEPLIAAKTGLLLDPYFSATKLKWMLDHVPGARARAEAGELAFGTVDSWLLWKLTGGAVHSTEPGNASRTLLYNLGAGDWDGELLELFGVPRAVLPAIRPSACLLGESSAAVFGARAPITGMMGDQQAALFGQACFDLGMSKNTYGTGCFLLMNAGTAPPDQHKGILSTAAWSTAADTAFALEGSVFVAGAVIQWLRDGLGLIRSAEESEALASTVADSGGVYLVPAFTGLGAPYWDPYARGILAGLTRGVTSAHIARAALESIAHQTADLLETMQQASGVSIRELRADGGASRNNLLLQMQADLSGIPVVRPAVSETTALGAALLAAEGAGLCSRWEIAARWRKDRVFEPRMDRDQAGYLRQGWKRAVERARDWARDRNRQI